MDLTQLNPAQLQTLMSLIQSLPTTGQPTGTRTDNSSSTIAHVPSTQPPIPPVQPPTTMAANSIGPYQSVRMPGVFRAPQGYPSQAMTQMSPGQMQPFLGRDNLALSVSDQVNQRRWASAANHPRQPRLLSRGRRRGPAVQPPSLPRRRDTHQMEDCLSTTINNGVEIPTIRIKVKVYPPLVRNLFNFCIVTLAKSLTTGNQYRTSNLLQVPTRIMECPIGVIPPSIFIRASTFDTCHDLGPACGQ